mmetsp:Transcript_5444/g.8439  ORF Transcript_5444/g.8439 Transcript_5444/m.8439 type:complete len:92 (+) Transcript_5444:100-375(+)
MECASSSDRFWCPETSDFSSGTCLSSDTSKLIIQQNEERYCSDHQKEEIPEMRFFSCPQWSACGNNPLGSLKILVPSYSEAEESFSFARPQ